MEGNMTAKLSMLVSSAEYAIVHYLKEHNGCTKKELMPRVINQISLRENKEGEIICDVKPIHTLAFILAIKELEREDVIAISRGDVPFPAIDNKSRFTLKQ